MTTAFVNIHTHRPTGCGIELRTAGIHPWMAQSGDMAAQIDSLRQALADDSAIEAIGEIGLDFARDTDRAQQEALFTAQLRLACERGLPVVLHCVRAFAQVMRCLREAEPRAVIFHGFIGSPEQAREALRRGYFLSFGERSFASRKSIEALRITPLEQLFLETDESDSPIGEVYARAAIIKGIEVDLLRQATMENYKRIFIHG